MSDSDTVKELRRQLGRRLAAARKDAGYAQREFATRINYARSTLSTVESGIQRAGRDFWQACDRVLRTGRDFEAAYDRIRAQQAAEHRNPPPPTPGQECDRLPAATLDEAAQAYQALGWPMVTDAETAALVTGAALDALEVPRAAGILAASWWRATAGAADQVRGLPGLPDPRQALAVIASADRWYFLASAGAFPWPRLPPGSEVPGPSEAPVVIWHSCGSQIPAPPGTGRDGQPANWAWVPSEPVQLASAVMLLDLLAKAVAATRQQPPALSLRSDVRVVPVLGAPQVRPDA
jgi:transcriptional regulator with XRE-family HTH domain